MERLLRVSTLLATAVAAVGTTTVVPVHHAPVRHAAPARPGLPPGIVRSALFTATVPLELNGRAQRWQNDQLLAQEAAAQAAAAAAAQQAAQQAAAARAAAAARPAAAAPAPAPAPAPVSYPAGSVQAIITQAFTPYGATAVAWGLRVAKCESGYNPRAYNGAGPYYGLFQFLMSTFKATPYGGQDIYDPVANASAAAWKYSKGGAGLWGCK